MGQPSGVSDVLHLNVCRPRQRVAVPDHGLRERGRRLPHSLSRGAHIHWPGEEIEGPLNNKIQVAVVSARVCKFKFG